MKRRGKNHGLSDTSEYTAWYNMKARCLKKTHPSYKNYGGRGITVCKEWEDSFLQFYKDMGAKPSPELSIDRIDNSKGYSKDNCRWADYCVQAQNTRLHKTNKSGIRGVSYCKRISKWRATITVHNKGKSLGTFHKKEDAIKCRKDAEATLWGDHITTRKCLKSTITINYIEYV